MINQEQIAAYREMAKNASENSMEAQIRANLESTCDKFDGHEDKFDRCMNFLVQVAKEILEGKNGEIPDEVCFRICRDYFNDEIWKAEDEENERKKAEDEENERKKAEEERLAKEKAEKEKKAPGKSAKAKKKAPGKSAKAKKKAPGKSAKAKKKAPAKPTNTAPDPEPEKDGTENPVAVVPEEPVTAESLVKKVAERNRLIIEANNKRLGIGLAETIDLFGTGK